MSEDRLQMVRATHAVRRGGFVPGHIYRAERCRGLIAGTVHWRVWYGPGEWDYDAISGLTFESEFEEVP